MSLMRSTALLVGVLLCGSASAVTTWVETGPPGAGSLPGETGVLATAQDIAGVPGSSLVSISGSLESRAPQNGFPMYEIDLFRIFISDLAVFSAEAVSSDPADDFSLFLFDALGVGIAMNDDTLSGLLPYLPQGGVGGPAYFFLGISLGGVLAVDGLLADVFVAGNFTDVRPGSGVALDGWLDPFERFSESPYSYTINLTGAQVPVPEPGTLPLLLLALSGLAASRRFTHK